MLVEHLQPPYYVAIFTSVLKEEHPGYHEMANKMEELAQKQEGFLGIDSSRSEIGITVSYWRDLPSLQAWGRNTEHLIAKQKGKEEWYVKHITRIAKVEKEY